MEEGLQALIEQEGLAETYLYFTQGITPCFRFALNRLIFDVRIKYISAPSPRKWKISSGYYACNTRDRA